MRRFEDVENRKRPGRAMWMEKGGYVHNVTAHGSCAGGASVRISGVPAVLNENHKWLTRMPCLHAGEDVSRKQEPLPAAATNIPTQILHEYLVSLSALRQQNCICMAHAAQLLRL